MYTLFFFFACVLSGIIGYGGDIPLLKALFMLFGILYVFSLIFDVCDRREARLEENEEEEEDYHAHRHYFD